MKQILNKFPILSCFVLFYIVLDGIHYPLYLSTKAKFHDLIILSFIKQFSKLKIVKYYKSRKQ